MKDKEISENVSGAATSAGGIASTTMNIGGTIKRPQAPEYGSMHEEGPVDHSQEKTKTRRTKEGKYLVVRGNQAWSHRDNSWHDLAWDIGDKADFTMDDRNALINSFAKANGQTAPLKDSDPAQENPPVVGHKEVTTEYDDPSSYVEKWKQEGFDINVEDYKEAGDQDGKKFHVSKGGQSHEILEPITGQYKVGSMTFPHFDDAMEYIISTANKDAYVTEMKRLSGISECDCEEENHKKVEEGSIHNILEKLTKIGRDDKSDKGETLSEEIKEDLEGNDEEAPEEE